MAQRQHVASELGHELAALEADDGARLNQILWRLTNQARRLPDDPDTAAALAHALALAGRAEEARRQAKHLNTLVTPASSRALRLNTLGSLLEAGLQAEALQRADELLVLFGDHAANPNVELELMLWHATHFAMRFGQLDWLRDRRVPLSSMVEFIGERGLWAWWPRQQKALETAIGTRVASTEIKLASDPESGALRIVLLYHTDVTSHAEASALLDVALGAVTDVYTAHPAGPGAFLEHLVVDVEGPQIPVEELAP